MRRIVALGTLVLLGMGAYGQFEDTYASYTDFFSFLEDPNTGLTTFPILTIPMGGEFEAMGTAYTAVARDASYLEANPAASAQLAYSEIALYHNNWIADTNIEGVSYTRRIDNLGYGFGGKFLYVPFTGYDIWGNRTASGYYSESVGIANVSYHFLQDYYFHGVSVGANLKVAYRHVPDAIATGQSAVGLMGDIGALTRLNVAKFYSSRTRNFAVGLVFRNLGPPVLDEPLPSMVSLGVSYSPLRPWTIAADINVPFNIASDAPAERIGGSLGTAVQVTDFFAVRAGFLMKGGNPRISLGSEIVVDLLTFTINYTLDMTTQFTNLDRFSVNVAFNFGDDGRKARELETERIYLEGIDLYAQGEFTQALQKFEEVLRRDPGYRPAYETRELVLSTIELREELFGATEAQ